ncbi:hypothetical protein GRI89_14640 [Altererythrobacter salegens]|uniref:Uncharacterized protein n=1 Tax=Croceibacterium salegens TaxID=1737568 RepID=A0A6I4SZB1_9SPHN|nr:hypothetical protein [Croceibacterium salegens]MXO60778.1 hypothetical protein [Croceibacterium salegens]
MTPGRIFWGSLIALSVGLPLLASRFPRVRWRYKAPLCLLLAYILSLAAILGPTHGRIGPTGLLLVMFFGLAVSGVVVLAETLIFKGYLEQ